LIGRVFSDEMREQGLSAFQILFTCESLQGSINGNRNDSAAAESSAKTTG
jgi:hypothetical protein